MRALKRGDKVGSANVEILALLLASISFVCVLTVILVTGDSASVAGLKLHHLLLLAGLIGASTVAFVVVWLATRHAFKAVRNARQEAARLRQSLVLAESIIKTEPQVVVCWEPGQQLKVLTHTLISVKGLPTQQAELLRFGEWLEPSSAEDLKSGLDQLFQAGQAFSLLLKTTSGSHLEADGRAVGARAVLRLRDVAAFKSDLVKVLEQHSQLLAELKSGRVLLDTMPMPVWLKGMNERIVWANQAYIEAVEASGLAEVRERQLELLEQRQRKAIAAALAEGECFAKRLPLVINGERRAHDVIVTSAEQCIAAIAVDVAALEKAEGELNRQMTTHDRTLDRVRTAVAVFDSDQHLTFYNEAYRKLWQLEPTWLDGRPTGGEILDRLRELARLPAIVDYRQWRGAVLDCHSSGALYDDWWQLPDGRLLHVVGEQRHDGGVTFLYDDASERLALEGKYNALIDVQRETLDSLKEGVAVFGTDGRLRLFNSAFLSIWRLSRETLEQGPHVDEINAMCRELFEGVQTWERLSRTVTAVTDEREPFEGQMVRRNQTVVDFAAAPLPDGGTLVTFVDVTASKRYERALEERNEALVASAKLKNQFISHVSYELRTPLTNIIGFGELLASPRTGPLAPKQREYLADIQASSTTLLSIINDILDLATIDAGTMELKLAPVSVQPIVDSAIQGVRERAMRARLTIDIATSEDDISFIADEDRVRQVIYNLLSNAVGFSNPGGLVRVSVWREAGHVVFAVEDQGVGIPKNQQDRVLERFESRSQGGKHRGAGLGLSIVKSLVELHNGEMRLESEPGHGTRATVRFPEVPASHRPLQSPEAERA